MMRILALSAPLLLMTGCEDSGYPQNMSAHEASVFRKALAIEVRRSGANEERTLTTVDPILFHLQGKTCVLFALKRNVLGSPSVVCYDDKTGALVEDYVS